MLKCIDCPYWDGGYSCCAHPAADEERGTDADTECVWKYETADEAETDE